MKDTIKINQTYNTETFLEELVCEVPKDVFSSNFDKAVDSIAKNASAPGFRKGHVPKNVVLKSNMANISDKAINLCIDEAVKNLHDLNPRPLEPLNVQNVAQKEDGGLTITLTYIPVPTVELPDVSKIKVKKTEAKKATDEEVEKELANMWFFYMQKLNPETKKEDFSLDKINDSFFKDTEIAKDSPEIKSVEDMKKVIKEYIDNTYERDALMSWESMAQQELIDASTFTKVEALVGKEVQKRIENYKARFTQIGMNAEEYMQKNNLTEEALVKDWLPGAQKDVKLEVMLQNYGAAHGIKPTEEEITAQLASLDENTKKSYNNNEENLRALITYYYVNNKAYEEMINQVKENSGLKEKEGEVSEMKPKPTKKGNKK